MRCFSWSKYYFLIFQYTKKKQKIHQQPPRCWVWWILWNFYFTLCVFAFTFFATSSVFMYRRRRCRCRFSFFECKFFFVCFICSLFAHSPINSPFRSFTLARWEQFFSSLLLFASTSSSSVCVFFDLLSSFSIIPLWYVCVLMRFCIYFSNVWNRFV